MEALKTQVKEAITLPKAELKQVISKPVVFVAGLFFSALLLVLIEAYWPGTFTGPVKRLLRAVGVKKV